MAGMIRRALATSLVPIGLLAVGSACSGSGTTVGSPAPTAIDATTPTTLVAAGVTAAPAGPAASYQQLDGLWVDLWAAVTTPDDPAAWARIDGFVDAGQVTRLRSAFADEAGARIGHHPVRTATTAEQVTIDDCLTETRANATAVGGVHYVGNVGWTDGHWSLTSLGLAGKDIRSSTCVPRSVSDAVVAAYEGFTRQEATLALSPDPDSPLVDELTTGSYRSLFHDWLAGMKARGEHAVVYTNGVQFNGEVYDYHAGLASVTDCVDAFPQYGKFDRGSNRITKTLEPGSRSLYELDFALEEGRWKVSDLRQADGADCVKRPSSRALAVVG